MELHQIQVTYQADDDRVLCRTSFKADDGQLQEIRAWFTRRMIKGLWPILLESMEKQVALDNPQAAHASGHVAEMQYHANVEAIRESGSFDTAYTDEIQSYPLGEMPILVTTVQFSIDPGKPLRMRLSSNEGGAFEIAFVQQVLHGFSSLLRDAVKMAGWDLELALPSGQWTVPASTVLN